jgi:hypothetical protein
MASLGSGNAVRAEYSAPVEAESDSGLRAAPPDPVKADHASIGAIMSRPGQELPRRSGIGLASDHASASGQVPVYAGGPGAGGAIVTPMGAPALAAAPSQAQAPQLSRPVDFAATIQKKPRYGSVAVGVLAICFAAAMTVFIWHRLQARAGADVNSNAAAAGAAPAADENASSSAPANASGEASARAPAEVSSDRTTWGEPVRPRAPGTATTSNPSPSPPSRGRRDGRRH